MFKDYKPFCQLMDLNTVNNWVKNIRKMLCPNVCLLCDKPTDGALCANCAAELPYLDKTCTRCALPLDEQDNDSLTCGECLADPPAFDRILAPFRYAEPIDQMIGRFKYQHSLPTGRVLGEYLAQHVAAHTPSVDLLLPVPLHTSRLRQRGFNQSAELAHWLNRHSKIPWRADVLARQQPGEDQRGASRKQRQKQVRQVFAIKATHIPKRIALVDDVVTTGATARTIAKLLRKSGVEYIEVWAVARTPK